MYILRLTKAKELKDTFIMKNNPKSEIPKGKPHFFNALLCLLLAFSLCKQVPQIEIEIGRKKGNFLNIEWEDTLRGN